jgi:hypothetical protein
VRQVYCYLREGTESAWLEFGLHRQHVLAGMSNDICSREQILKDTVADGLSIQHRFRPEPTDKTTGRGSYRSDTVADIAAAKKKSLRQG